MKDQKGITLIALIITIIVMLILVTVSITIALQTGLFSAAGKAASKTNEAQAGENKLSSGVVNVDGVGEKNVGDMANYFITNYAD